MKAQREVHTQLHPSVTSTLHTGQWLDQDIICFLYTTVGQTVTYRPHLPAAVILLASESFKPHVPYTPVGMKDNVFNDLVNFI